MPFGARAAERSGRRARAAAGHLGGAAAEPADTQAILRYREALAHRTRQPGVGQDAGMPSDRLNALQASVGLGHQQLGTHDDDGAPHAAAEPVTVSPYKAPRASTRREQGIVEGRAGTGPEVPNEHHLLEKPPRRVMAPATSHGPTAQRNPILCEKSDISPDRTAPPTGRVTLGATRGAIDHLQSTLVPGADGDYRRRGKATGYPAVRQTHDLISAEAPAESAAAGGEAAPRSGRAKASGGGARAYGKLHLAAPTHETRPFHLVHEAHVPSPGPPHAEARPPPAPSPAKMRHPPLLLQQSSQAYADARSDYDSVRSRGVSSSIFSDMRYPDGPS